MVMINKIYGFVITGVLLILFAWGCSPHYIERETPSGTVPPYIPNKNLQTLEGNSAPEASTQQTSAKTEELVSKDTIERFATIYSGKNSPRIAIFLNRTLSDEVEEWRSDTKLVMAGEKVTSEKISGKERKSTETKEAVTVNIEERAGSDAKASKPEDRWMWAFEDGFLQPFLQAKAKVVDRATIIRLTAAESDKGATLQPIVAKQTETDALKGYADILVEILITRSPSSLYGYEFKASAKDLKTGSIIANVTSLRWKAKDHPGRVVVASSEGYKVTNEVKLPAVADVASGLATDLMNALIRFWGK